MPQTLLRNFTINAGDGLDMMPGFFVKGVRVDNYTSVWYKIQPQGYIIPPATTAWTTDLPQASQSINIQPTTYSNQPNYIFTGDTLTVTVFSDPVGISGGSPSIPNDQRTALFTALPGATLSTGTLTFPATGTRIDNLTGTWYQIGSTGVLVPPWTTGFTIDISPAIVALTLTPIAAPYGPANSATGTGVTLTLYASKIGNYGGTTGTVSSAFVSVVQTITNIATGNFTLTVTIAPAAAKNLLVASFSFSGNSAGTVTPPAGWTQISTNASAVTGYWTGYKIAAGGETTATATYSAGDANSCVAGLVTEYTGFPIGIFQTATATATTVSITPTTAPNQLICLSAWSSHTSVDPGTATSSTTVLRNSVNAATSSNRAAVAIGDLKYTTVASEVGAISWSGGAGTGQQTSVITGE